jgi:hypothetical protein
MAPGAVVGVLDALDVRPSRIAVLKDALPGNGS